MIHIMKLKEPYFNYIKYGTKEYEIRLNDEKRIIIKKGDFIEFQKEPLLEESIIVIVDDILYYNDFSDLLKNIKIDYLADSSISREDLEKDLELFYPIEKQKKYGVVAIKLRKNNIISYSSLKYISSSNEIFNILRKNYIDFDIWLNKIQLSNANVFYTESNNKITSLLILKIKEDDSQQFFEKGNILKIRTFLVNNKKKGIGTTYLDIVNDISIKNSIDYIYLTIKINNKELIDFMEKNGYKKYSQYNDEFVYYKELK